MTAPKLARNISHGVTLLGDTTRPGGVTLAFTERTGGVSEGCFSSLNLGTECGDDMVAVQENRRRVLGAIGAQCHAGRLICPLQVHGDRVLVVGKGQLAVKEAQRLAREGADAIVCAEANVPVLLCSADCVLVILVTEGAFAVIHSGWRGCLARIAGKALRKLVAVSGHGVADVRVYVGPHIGVDDYEVSEELAGQFVREFGEGVLRGSRHIDLGYAVCASLAAEGVDRSAIACVEEFTACKTDRFFSYRAQGGECGRIGAVACILADKGEVRS